MKKYMRQYALSLVLAVVVLFSFLPKGDITATPKFWRDEAIPFDIARSFVETGTFDVSVAPGVANTYPYLTHATGFPVTLPLAGFFKLFGIGVFQSRIYMILWLLATVSALYFVIKSFFGWEAAFAGALLVATFGPLYANGRTSTGEIPGFFFLIVALYLFYKKDSYLWGGVFLALAAVTKPSIYLLVFPVFVLEQIFSRRSKFVEPVIKTALGALPIILLWIWIILPHPFSIESWKGMFALYGHPFHEPSLFSQFPGVLASLLTHSTILYFLGLTGVLLWAYYKGVYVSSQKNLIRFIFIYGIFCTIYFLRSPGWLRFLIAYQLFILACMYPAIARAAKNIRLSPLFIISALLCIHVSNFLFFSNIPSGKASLTVGEFINSNIVGKNPNDVVGFINLPTIAPLIPAGNKIQIAEIGGNDTYGVNPLSLAPEKLPRYVVANKDEYGQYTQVLEHYYRSQPFATVESLKIFERNLK